jgi:signal transduction histidine kinase
MDAEWMTVASTARTSTESPVSRSRVLTQVIATAAVVIVTVAVLGLFVARHLAEVEAVNDAVTTADLIADALVQPAITDGLLTGDAESLATLDDVVRNHVLNDSIVRVKIWSDDGRILYSDEPRLIGQQFELEGDELEVLADHRIRADVSDLQEPENVYERDSGKLLEAYRPVWTPAGTPLLFETYVRYDEVDRRSEGLVVGFSAVTLGSILLLVILLLPVLARLLDVLGRAQAQREALLLRAIDSSSDERRRIAGALHDGVVQDLAGTSFALAASVESARASGESALAEQLATSASTVRGSIGGLRSLLVDIYPPSLARAGLSSALADVASSLRSRGVTVDLAIAPDAGLDQPGEQLVFRVTQEVLANAARHANATVVSVQLERTATGAQLDITDDGVGFDAPAVFESPADGHFGLRVLGDLVSDAGGTLLLRTAPGEGTHWRLAVDRP